MFNTEKWKNRPNKFAGSCAGCSQWVISQAGLLGGEPGGWLTVCTQCATGEAAPEAVAEKTYPLTEEQEHVLDLFKTGESIAVQAGAGTGKTTTLMAIANSTTRKGQYIAFNTDIVRAAQLKLPRNVQATTAHSLAMSGTSKVYAPRLGSNRMKSHEIAKWLGIKAFSWSFAGESHTLAPGALAGYVYLAIKKFCNSADSAPLASKHMESINGLDKEGSHVRRDRLHAILQPFIDAAWSDLVNPAGVLPFNHDHYLKIWALGDAKIPGDFMTFDEAQDASPVVVDVVKRQGKQVVWVGDSMQGIYEWRGAVDALATVGAEHTAYLTHSFRFGQAIADVANLILDTIASAKLRLVGRGGESSTGFARKPDAIICRTNAGAMGSVLQARADGHKAVLVGKNDDIAAFVRAAIKLQDGRKVEHFELACFASWAEVEEYAENDPNGADLAKWVNLFTKFSPEQVLDAVTSTTKIEDADVVVTTTHKSKGLEWNTVQLCGDFPYNDPDKGKTLNDSDKKLLYVAATRAMKHLDFEDCTAIADLVYGR